MWYIKTTPPCVWDTKIIKTSIITLTLKHRFDTFLQVKWHHSNNLKYCLECGLCVYHSIGYNYICRSTFPSFGRDVYKWENWILHLIVRHYLFLQPINRKVFPLFQHSINWKRLACLFVSRSFCYWGYSLLALIQRLRNLKLRVRFFLKLLRRFESHIRFYAQSTGQKISEGQYGLQIPIAWYCSQNRHGITRGLYNWKRHS